MALSSLMLDDTQALALARLQAEVQRATDRFTGGFTMVCASHKITNATLISLDGTVLTLEVPDGS